MRPLELFDSLGKTTQLGEERAANRGEQVIPVEPVAGGQFIQRGESGRGSVNPRDGDGFRASSWS